jgi:hypothetical protein
MDWNWKREAQPLVPSLLPSTPPPKHLETMLKPLLFRRTRNGDLTLNVL